MFLCTVLIFMMTQIFIVIFKIFPQWVRFISHTFIIESKNPSHKNRIIIIKFRVSQRKRKRTQINKCMTIYNKFKAVISRNENRIERGERKWWWWWWTTECYCVISNCLFLCIFFLICCCCQSFVTKQKRNIFFLVNHWRSFYWIYLIMLFGFAFNFYFPKEIRLYFRLNWLL